jgi:hypothetical protein
VTYALTTSRIQKRIRAPNWTNDCSDNCSINFTACQLALARPAGVGRAP